MNHVSKIKQMIEDQGYTIEEIYKIAGSFFATISKDGVEKDVMLALSSQNEIDYFRGLIDG